MEFSANAEAETFGHMAKVEHLWIEVFIVLSVQTKTISIMYAVREDVQGLVNAVYVCMCVYRRRQLA